MKWSIAESGFSMQNDKLTFDRSYPPIERPFTGFQPAALQAYLDGEFVETRNLVKSIITRPEFRHFEGHDRHEYRRQVLIWLRTISDAGLGRWFLPPELGGEANLSKLMAVVETLSFHDGSLLIKLGVQFGLFGLSIQQLGTEYHHRAYLPKAAACQLLGGFAMTEIGHGSNVQALETTAVYDSEHRDFIINSPSYSSGKTFIGNAAVDGQFMVVFAQLHIGAANHGVHAFLVPIRDENGQPLPGVSIEDNGHKLGLNGVDNGRIWFQNIRLPKTELLNRFAEVTDDGQYRSEIKSNNSRFFTMIGTLVDGRITMALAANGMAKSALTIAIRYAARRRQFGGGLQETLLLDYPATQRRLMPLLANAYAFDFAVKRLVRIREQSRDAGTGARAIETLAAGIKAFSTWTAMHTIQVCRESCGGEGYMFVNRFAALKADADIFTTFEGDNTVLMQLVAKNLLGELKDRLKEMNPGRIARFFVDQRLKALKKRFMGLTAASASLLNPEQQLVHFRLRESTLLLRAGGKFRRLTRHKAMDAYSAFIHLQPELLELAEAYAERQVLESFLEAVAAVPEQTLQRPLQKLADLFALYHLEKHKDWFLENGFMAGRRAIAITSHVTRLCQEVRQDAVALVDAFGIPDQCLGAPIALG
ncbi:MAG TPA: acyl-CoA dehydrogenase [Chthoniobacterales bacterium]|nr:acyl-CoA dehydrogenase [Chthoniobacterales bacterium]